MQADPFVVAHVHFLDLVLVLWGSVVSGSS